MAEHTDIVFTRHRGKGITIDHAPARTRLDPRVLADRNTYLRLPEPDVIVFADQVVYRITGFEGRALLLELIEDWRPAPAAPQPPAGEPGEVAKARWKENHDGPGAVNGAPVQVVTPVVPRQEQPSA